MKKVWILEHLDNGKWTGVEGSTNYFRFNPSAKKFLKKADDEALIEFEKELGKVEWSEEIRDKYKNMHTNVKNSFRVITSEIPDDSKDWTVYDKDKTVINEGVLSYMWNTKNEVRKKKENA